MTTPLHSVIITGGTGFIGSRLAKQLLESGTEVTLLLRPTSNITQLEILGIAEQVKLARSDLSTESIAQVMREVQPDVVFHLASCFISQHVTADLDELIVSNITLGCRILESMVTAGVRNIVNAGTAWQHYQQADYSPVNLYAATKQAFVDLAEYYCIARSIRLLNLELPDTYGPQDPRRKLIYLLIESAKTGEPLAMSPGEQKIDLVHVDDVTAAFSIAGTRLVGSRQEDHGLNTSYAVTSGSCPTLKEIVQSVEQVVGHALPVTFGAREYRPREMMEPNTKTPRLPDWQPAVALKQGLMSLGIGRETV